MHFHKRHLQSRIVHRELNECALRIPFARVAFPPTCAFIKRIPAVRLAARIAPTMPRKMIRCEVQGRGEGLFMGREFIRS